MKLLYLLALPCIGCVTEPLATVQTNNQQMQVDLLFEHDGCRIYRFRDIGFHYYAQCEGAGRAASLLPDKCGKDSHECGNVPNL
jgi:hypothetical protein